MEWTLLQVLRSYLFVPGSRRDRFDKALAAGADAIIIDLEDAVPPPDKVTARERVAGWLSAEHPVIVRVNEYDSEWFRDDIAACRHAGVAGVVLPKAARVEQVQAVIDRVGRAVSILPLVETAQGIWNAEALARSPQVERLLFGTIDLSIDMNLSGGEDDLLYYRSHIVLVSRVAGIQPPVDGVTTTFDSPEPVRADAQRARRLGFGGKLCIHPKQIAPVHEAFAPTPDEVAWAFRVVAAAGSSAGAATALDGTMVDRPVVTQAEAILSRHAAIAPAPSRENSRPPDR
jgi:citrate lyase subunit beta / citryl-CoA lyase